MRPRVSVIVPVYNVEQYLNRCLKSVTRQTYSNIEILLIDDGSTDSSSSICESWKRKDNRIILIHQENKGLGETRNIGIRRATGEYVAFLDSDDWWELNALEELIDSAERYDSDIVVMNFFFSEEDEKGKITDRPFAQYYLIDSVTNAKETPEVLFTTDERIWSKLYRRKLFVDNDLYMPAHPFEDFPITPVLMMTAKKISQVNLCLLHYYHKRVGNLVGNLNNYKWIPMGIGELKENIIRMGFWNLYQDRFREYAYLFLKRLMATEGAKELSPKKYEEFCKPFFEGLRLYCPESLSIKDVKVFLLGSESGRLIERECFFDAQIVGCDDLPIAKHIEKNLDKMKEADYILIDFLDMVINKNCDIEREIQELTKQIKKNGVEEKIILVELFLSERYGIHRRQVNQYENIALIREKNKLLEKCYEGFICSVSGKSVAFSEFNDYLYTYAHTKSGCKPKYYNRRFHEKTAMKIKQFLQCICS